ncbi:dipeptidyl aminopeptidase-like protein 6, partial [Trichonephila clavata]
VYEQSPPSRKGWVDLQGPIFFGQGGKNWYLRLPLPEGQHGHYQHVAMANNDTRHVDFLTQGRFDIYKVVAYHEASNTVYYLTTMENRPGERHLFSVSGKKARAATFTKCLTCEEGESCLFFNVIFSPDSQYYVLECLGPGVPKVEIRSIYNQTFDPCHILGSRFISFVSTATDCIRKGKKKLTMSETHSEQRKLGKVVESSANKKARREVSKKYGKFTEDCIPDGVFPIGDDVFVFASIYYDSVSVHIRRFKKYGKTYYPTPEGITLDPQWIEYIMRKKKVPESLEELPSGLFPPERHIQITSENFTNFTFKRIKYGPNKEPTFKEISISREQWAEMIEKYSAIENAVIDNVFLCMDFLTAYKTFCEGPIENALPFSLDVSLGQRYLTQILKKIYL